MPQIPPKHDQFVMNTSHERLYVDSFAQISYAVVFGVKGTVTKPKTNVILLH